MSPPLRELGLSLDQSIDAIDTFSGLLVTNAASAEKGKSAIGALSTAMQKGKLDANGWGTILSTMPSIVDLLAQSMGRSAAEIRRLGAEGKLTAKDLAKALVEGNAEVIKQVELMPTTARDAVGRLIGVATEYLGKNNEAISATATLASGIDFLAQNFDLLASAVGLVAAVFASRFVGAQYEARQDPVGNHRCLDCTAAVIDCPFGRYRGDEPDSSDCGDATRMAMAVRTASARRWRW